MSFDRGESWPVKRIVKTGPGNYTWMAAGRKGTHSEGMIYLLSNKDWMARFNLAWLLEKQNQAARTFDKFGKQHPLPGQAEGRGEGRI